MNCIRRSDILGSSAIRDIYFPTEVPRRRGKELVTSLGWQKWVKYRLQIFKARPRLCNCRDVLVDAARRDIKQGDRPYSWTASRPSSLIPHRFSFMKFLLRQHRCHRYCVSVVILSFSSLYVLSSRPRPARSTPPPCGHFRFVTVAVVAAATAASAATSLHKQRSQLLFVTSTCESDVHATKHPSELVRQHRSRLFVSVALVRRIKRPTRERPSCLSMAPPCQSFDHSWINASSTEWRPALYASARTAN